MVWSYNTTVIELGLVTDLVLYPLYKVWGFVIWAVSLVLAGLHESSDILSVKESFPIQSINIAADHPMQLIANLTCSSIQN